MTCLLDGVVSIMKHGCSLQGRARDALRLMEDLLLSRDPSGSTAIVVFSGSSVAGGHWWTQERSVLRPSTESERAARRCVRGGQSHRVSALSCDTDPCRAIAIFVLCAEVRQLMKPRQAYTACAHSREWRHNSRSACSVWRSPAAAPFVICSHQRGGYRGCSTCCSSFSGARLRQRQRGCFIETGVGSSSTTTVSLKYWSPGWLFISAARSGLAMTCPSPLPQCGLVAPFAPSRCLPPRPTALLCGSSRAAHWLRVGERRACSVLHPFRLRPQAKTKGGHKLMRALCLP